MANEIIIPRGKNVGNTIQAHTPKTAKVKEIVSIKRDLINKCIIATVVFTYLV